MNITPAFAGVAGQLGLQFVDLAARRATYQLPPDSLLPSESCPWLPWEGPLPPLSRFNHH